MDSLHQIIPTIFFLGNIKFHLALFLFLFAIIFLFIAFLFLHVRDLSLGVRQYRRDRLHSEIWINSPALVTQTFLETKQRIDASGAISTLCL